MFLGLDKSSVYTAEFLNLGVRTLSGATRYAHGVVGKFEN